MKIVICPACSARIGIPDNFQITDAQLIHCPKCQKVIPGADIPEKMRRIECIGCKSILSVPESSFNKSNPNVNCPMCNLTFKAIG
jgi:uncharacterized paraquat-inducible protein A